jgi:hypothetical protein
VAEESEDVRVLEAVEHGMADGAVLDEIGQREDGEGPGDGGQEAVGREGELARGAGGHLELVEDLGPEGVAEDAVKADGAVLRFLHGRFLDRSGWLDTYIGWRPFSDFFYPSQFDVACPLVYQN